MGMYSNWGIFMPLGLTDVKFPVYPKRKYPVGTRFKTEKYADLKDGRFNKEQEYIWCTLTSEIWYDTHDKRGWIYNAIADEPVERLDNHWNSSFNTDTATSDKELDLYFLKANLPPLKVFLGWTPMKEWISKCKPFVPRQKTWLDLIQPRLNGITGKILMISTVELGSNNDFMKMWETQESEHINTALYRIFIPAVYSLKDINDIMGIPKEFIGENELRSPLSIQYRHPDKVITYKRKYPLTIEEAMLFKPKKSPNRWWIWIIVLFLIALYFLLYK